MAEVMSVEVQVARAQVQYPGKGEDASLVRPLGSQGAGHLLAVADGLSLNNGKAAAEWAINYLERVSGILDLRSAYHALQQALVEARQPEAESETTLTCGILKHVPFEGGDILRFEYFAIGDSPIWKVIRGEKGSKYPFQRFVIHDAPSPSEAARVYATLRLHCGDIKGSVTFGSVDIERGEVLVVCSDGLPEREIFVRDARTQTADEGVQMKLCSWLFQIAPYSDEDLGAVMAGYKHRGTLFDDATIIVARMGQPAPFNRPEPPSALLEASPLEGCRRLDEHPDELSEKEDAKSCDSNVAETAPTVSSDNPASTAHVTETIQNAGGPSTQPQDSDD
jgi:serine/threonine protein phosphatase PrpC